MSAFIQCNLTSWLYTIFHCHSIPVGGIKNSNEPTAKVAAFKRGSSRTIRISNRQGWFWGHGPSFFISFQHRLFSILFFYISIFHQSYDYVCFSSPIRIRNCNWRLAKQQKFRRLQISWGGKLSQSFFPPISRIIEKYYHSSTRFGMHIAFWQCLESFPQILNVRGQRFGGKNV